MNTFLNEMIDRNNFGYTENGAVKHLSTRNMVLDMFALGGSYRSRSEEDCILLFKNAFEENAEMALKCLFYLGDCRGGQGERRYFRVCFKWLSKNYPEVAKKFIKEIPVYRRWDDVLYSCVGTPIVEDALTFFCTQLKLDTDCQIPSLCGKWAPSENASSDETRKMGNLVRAYMGMSHKQYRKMLSDLRSRINIVEKIISEGRWDEVKYDKIPSKAGLIYRNAFAKHDYDRYKSFLDSKKTKVNAAVLNPVDIAHKAFSCYADRENPERVMLNKAWENLKDYYHGREENGLCVVDVSGSMTGVPMEAAVSMGAYIAERGHGPFANHFITFSERPRLVKFEGMDTVDKLKRCCNADWGYSTNIESVFNMLLNTAKRNNVHPEDIPTRLYIFSDMEFNRGMSVRNEAGLNTLLEEIAKKWEREGYALPQLIFWNLDARSNNIPAIGGRFAYISGFSMSAIEGVLSGKDGWDLCLEILMSDRYKSIAL